MFIGYTTVNAQYDNSFRYHFSSFSPYIQDENGDHFWLKLEYQPGSQENKKTIERRLTNKLKTISKSSHNKKGEKTITTTHHFNELGRIVKVETYYHKKEKSYSTTINYLNDSIISSVETQNFKGLKTIYTYTYLELNSKFLLTSAIINKKGAIKEKLIIERNELGKITSRKQFYGNNLKKTSETKHEYNGSGDLIKTSYFHNEKLKSVYNYDCNPEGKKIEDKKVNVSDVCKWTEERNDGTYIVYSRSTSEKKNYLNVWLYNKDSMVISNKRYLNDSILVSSFTNYENTQIQNTYTDKQKLKRSSYSIYDNEHNLLESKYAGYLFLNKYNHYTINEYQNNQLKVTRSMREGKKVSTWTYEYNDIGLRVSSSHKKGTKQMKNYTYTFEYSFY